MPLIRSGTLVAVLIAAWPCASTAQRYSTGGVDNYPKATCGGPNLALCVSEVRTVQVWYDMGGLTRVTNWEDGNVWGSDFREGAGFNDTDPSGGSDVPDVYLFAGHGLCENPPAPGTGDFILTCGNFGKPDMTRIGTSSRWGNGSAKFMFLDASCPIDLPEVESEWFTPFDGLHISTGNSGDVTHDVYDSVARGSQVAAYTVGANPLFWGILATSLFPQLPVGDAWMATGIIDVQPQNCAVALAAGETRDDAINRRENEFVTSGWSDPTPNWFAWKWICAN